MCMKRGKRFLVIKKVVSLKSFLLFAIVFSFLAFGFLSVSGLTINHNVQGNFTGTYSNTYYNTSTSSIKLSLSNLSGNYTSQVVDAGENVRWDNLSWNGIEGNSSVIYAVDAQSDVWNSLDKAATWNLVKDDYNNGDGNGVTTSFFNNEGSYFIFFNQKVWRSENLGINWTNIVSDYNGADGQSVISASVDGNNFMYIIEGDEDVWRSNNSGVNWTKVASNFNEGNGNVFGLVINSSNTLIVADNQADIWISTDQGVNWTLIKDDYNGAAGNNVDNMAIDSNNTIYILDIQDVWNSVNSGVTWSKVNDDFNGAGDSQAGKVITVDSQGNVYVVDGGEDVFKSTDGGVTFTQIATDFNGGNGQVSTMTSVLRTSNLTYQFRNCSSSDCSDGSFRGPDGTASSFYDSLNGVLNVTSRYFQYKFYFNSPSFDSSPILYNVSLDYSTLNSAPYVNIVHPSLGQKFIVNSSISFNFTINDSEGNLQACWYSLNNGANVSLTNCANTSLNVLEGSNSLRLYANDSQGSLNSQNITFLVDSVSPLVSLVYPTNSSFSSLVSALNYTAQDSNLESCWYSLDNGINNVSVSCGSNVSGLNSGQGNSIWKIYANDSFGNLGSASVTFSVDSINPSLSIAFPTEGQAFGNNMSLSLNYSVSDSNLQACWYNIDDSVNVSINGCLNTTFNVSEGSHSLKLYANDSFGNGIIGQRNFSVNVGAPSISLSSPVDGEFLKMGNVSFVYTADDLSLKSCELWGNFTGTFELNQTNSSAVLPGVPATFALNLSDGNYFWNIKCNDGDGNSAFNGNRSFVVDTINPSVILSQPTGVKSSRNNVPLSYFVSDSNVNSCWFNVLRGGNIEVANTSLSCSSGSSLFDVTVDADFILNFYANDSAGNSNQSSISFSVLTSSGGTGGSGSGGGSSSGGGGGVIPSTSSSLGDISIGFGLSEEIVIKKGESREFKMEITNGERRFLNKCSLYGDWIAGNIEKGLSFGEKYEYSFTLVVPESIEPGVYTNKLLFRCEEGEADTNLIVNVYRNSFEVQVENYKKNGNRLQVNYLIEEFSKQDHKVNVNYIFSDFDGVTRARGSDFFEINIEESKNYVLEFDLPKDSFGEFYINSSFDDGDSRFDSGVKVFLPSRGFSALAISSYDREVLSKLGIVAVFVLLAFLFYRIFRRTRISFNKFYGHGYSPRRLIKILPFR